MRSGVLVTGGAGFIGSHLVDRLLGLGEPVTVLDDFNDFYTPRDKWRNLESAISRPDFRLVVGDIRDPSALKEAFLHQPIDRVVHLAARAGVQPSLRDPVLYADVNVNGTAIVLDICREMGVRQLVFASSSSVYGASSAIPFREDDRADFPLSPYAATKRANELQCWTYHHLTQVPVTCLRFFTAYGPRQRPDMAVYRFAQAIRDGREILLFGADTRRDFTFIDDLVDGIVAALERPDGFLICNVGRGQLVAVSHVIEQLERLLGQPAWVVSHPLPAGDVPVTWADISTARSRLDYRPRVSLTDGLERFVRWFNEGVVSPQQTPQPMEILLP